MKRLFGITMLFAIAVFTAVAQNKAETEVLKFNSDYERAQMNRDVAFFERVMAADYTFSGPMAEIEDKAKAIAWLRGEKDKPTHKVVSMTSEDVKAKVIGNNAILTGTWVFTSLPIADDKAEPHIDKGRYTVFLEKRAGQWIVLAEHVSEAPHDRKLMEQQVMKAGQAYGEIMKRRDAPAFERLFADEYIYTSEEGKTRNKAEDIAHMTSPDMVIESSEISDQKVRVIGNGAAIETGMYKMKGKYKDNAFDETGRYTTTWVWRGGRWQIVSDHTSRMK
ncbi:hypothetical protein BH20ACI2_BH20ACI2_25170 [soil metagenome]